MATLGTSNEKTLRSISLFNIGCRGWTVCMPILNQSQDHHVSYLLKTSEARMRVTTLVPTSSQVGGWNLTLSREERRVERKWKHANKNKRCVSPACAVPSPAVVKCWGQLADAALCCDESGVSHTSPFNPGATINPRPIEATMAQTTIIKPRMLIQANARGIELVVK